MTPRIRSALMAAIVWVLAFDAAWLWQRASGAHGSEYGGHPDEAAHFVTGLFVRGAIAMLPGCLAEGSFGRLRQFADKDDPSGFYAHYPKVGLGVWPPGFYLVQTAWTLPFGAGRASIMFLMASLAATLALLFYLSARGEYGPPLAFAGMLALVSLPLVRHSYSMVMAEILTAIFMFAAVLLFGRFIDSGRARDAWWFGVLAGLAIMTKGTGLALVLVPPIAIVLTGRWDILKRPALWGGACLCAIVAGPWTVAFRNAGRDKGGWLESSPSNHFSNEAVPYYAVKFGLALGFVLAAFFCIGVIVKLVRREQRTGFWTSVAALIIAVLLFHFVLPVGLEERHLVSVMPSALLFVVAGLHAVLARLAARARLIVAVAVLLVGIFIQQVFDRPERKDWSGFAPLAQHILASDPEGKSPVLVSSDARGEGQFVSEIAMRERRPGRVVRRGSKDLASSDWAGRDLKLRFATEDDLADWFGNSSIDFVVADASMPEENRNEQHDQLIRACENRSDRFWPMLRLTVVRAGFEQPGPLMLYRVKH
jgi:hypothetical protein